MLSLVDTVPYTDQLFVFFIAALGAYVNTEPPP